MKLIIMITKCTVVINLCGCHLSLPLKSEQNDKLFEYTYNVNSIL